MKRKRPLTRISGALLIVLLLTCLPLSVAATETPTLVTADSDAVTVDYEVNKGYTWTYKSAYSNSTHAAYVAGNSGTSSKNVSNLAITVTRPGILTFDYNLSTPSSGDTYAFYYQLGSPITADNYKNAANHSAYSSYRGNRATW